MDTNSVTTILVIVFSRHRSDRPSAGSYPSYERTLRESTPWLDAGWRDSWPAAAAVEDAWANMKNGLGNLATPTLDQLTAII